MLPKDQKEKIIKKFRTHETDTGSSEIQIAILTEEIKQLTEHLKAHPKDFSSRRGLIKKINDRRKLMLYLMKTDSESLQSLIKKLKIKMPKQIKKKEDELPPEVAKAESGGNNSDSEKEQSDSSDDSDEEK